MTIENKLHSSARRNVRPRRYQLTVETGRENNTDDETAACIYKHHGDKSQQ